MYWPTIVTQKLEEAPSSQGLSTEWVLQNLTECNISEQSDGKQPALNLHVYPTILFYLKVFYKKSWVPKIHRF